MKTFSEQDGSYRWPLGADTCASAGPSKHHQTSLGHQVCFMWHRSTVGFSQLNHKLARFSEALLDSPHCKRDNTAFLLEDYQINSSLI